MTHLHELLASRKHEVYLSDCWNRAEEAADWHRQFMGAASQAICFDMGDCDQLHDIKPVQQLSQHLPFPTCWFEQELSGEAGRPMRFATLLHTKEDGTLVLWLYMQLDGRWWIWGAADLKSMWTSDFVIFPQSNKFAELVVETFNVIRVFISVLSCENVIRVETRPAAKLQRARAKRGKPPLFSYWTLHLATERAQAGGGAGAGSHASPRLHLRRCFMRQYKPGLWTCVKATVVGNKAMGMVHKEYAVTPKFCRGVSDSSS